MLAGLEPTGVELPGYRVAGLSLPHAVVSGDLHDWHRDGDDLVLTLADVMGKGMSAGLLAASVLPFALGILGWVYLALGVVIGGGVLLGCQLQLRARPTDRRLALRSFHASNLFLLLLFLAVALDVVLGR